MLCRHKWHAHTTILHWHGEITFIHSEEYSTVLHKFKLLVIHQTLWEKDTENHTEKSTHIETPLTRLKSFTKDSRNEIFSSITMKFFSYCYSRTLTPYNPTEKFSALPPSFVLFSALLWFFSVIFSQWKDYEHFLWNLKKIEDFLSDDHFNAIKHLFPKTGPCIFNKFDALYCTK